MYTTEIQHSKNEMPLFQFYRELTMVDCVLKQSPSSGLYPSSNFN